MSKETLIQIREFLVEEYRDADGFCGVGIILRGEEGGEGLKVNWEEKLPETVITSYCGYPIQHAVVGRIVAQ